MYRTPIRKMIPSPPLESFQFGDTVHLRPNTFQPFPAELIAKQNIIVGSGSVRCWSWREVTYAPYGQFVVVEGGRSGDSTANPAFEIQHDYAATGNIVWMRPGWNAEAHGQEWLFRCDCRRRPGVIGEMVDSACCPNGIPANLVATMSNLVGEMSYFDTADDVSLTYSPTALLGVLPGWVGDSDEYATGFEYSPGVPLTVRYRVEMQCTLDTGFISLPFPSYVQVTVRNFAGATELTGANLLVSQISILAPGGISQFSCDPFEYGVRVLLGTTVAGADIVLVGV